jgi:hypothetical protein
MGAVRLLRTVAPLALVAGLAVACGNGSSSSGTSTGDSTVVGASSGFEVRTVYARYAPGVPFGPQIPKAVVGELSSQSCPMKPRIVDEMVMECDAAKTVYLLDNPVVDAKVASATPQQIGHSKLWDLEVKLDPTSAKQLGDQQGSMTGQQIAFCYGGAVLTSIAIDSSFHAEHFAITGNYDKAGATRLAQELTG